MFRLFDRSFDFKCEGFLPRVSIDVESAPEVCFLLVGRIHINADIRRLALGKQFLFEGCGQAFAGRGHGVNHEFLVACIPIDKVEGIARIVPVQREVADSVIENDARICWTFRRAREENTEMNEEQDENDTSGMIHNNFRIKFWV